MPDAKVVKNRLHLDIHVSGGAGTTDRSVPLATRIQRVDAGAESRERQGQGWEDDGRDAPGNVGAGRCYCVLQWLVRGAVAVICCQNPSASPAVREIISIWPSFGSRHRP
jgi:hypothetical protein